MNKSRISLIAFAIFATLLCALLAIQTPMTAAQTSTITVQVDKPGAAIPSTQFGIFFEDINFGADGGIYPERVKNRSFEFPVALMGWQKIERSNAKGTLAISEQNPINANNQHYLRVKAESSGDGFGVTNEGFRGIGVQKDAQYVFSVFARRTESGPLTLRAEVVDANGKSLGQAKLGGFTDQWRKHSVTLRATATEAKARLNIFVEGSGAVDLDEVSLFPKDTWKNRPNGLRSDLVQLLSDLKPGFVRFPGGCIVEGRDLKERYQWKTTIGHVAERKLIINRWNVEFKSRNPERAAADYYQSFGLGFYEYFQLCEDVGAEPLPILNCGMACQFNTNELVPLDQLDPYIQDALDLIEFANGSVATKWGRRRAELGHPAPFNMKLLGVGNEQWGPQYIERYEPFAKALKAKHPNITLISSAGPSPQGERFDFLWGKLKALNADVIDEHYYMPPKWFLDNAGRYDNYPRTGPKVFAGEFAAHVPAKGRPDRPNNLEAAIAEAAFMTGLERNADVVPMASYAPLFGHVEAWQWSPNLIWFDNLRSFGTPSYYVQKLFSANRGTNVLPVLLNGSPKNAQNGLYASASVDKRTGEVILKVVNASASAREVSINLAGAGKVGKAGKAFVLANTDPTVENSLNEAKKIAPVERQLPVSAGQFTYALAANSLAVLRLPSPSL
jgi:alpha-N-arabinofuranosidase